MPRPLLPLLGLCALTACIDIEPIDIPPLFTCDQPLFPGGMCVDDTHPIDFERDYLTLAEGGATPFAYLTLDGLAFTVASDAPEIMTATLGADGTLTLAGVSAGATELVARGADGAVLRRVAVEVAPIAAVAFRFDPAGDVDLTELAAVPGAAEALRLVARDARGLDLAGAAPALQLETTGPISSPPLDQAEHRFTGFFGPERPGFLTAVRFDGVGDAAVVARRGGVELSTLPIAVIPAAADVELRLYIPTTPVDTLQAADLVGSDARGVPVAGLTADFTATPAALVRTIVGRGAQGLFEAEAPGVVTLTATLPDRTLTASFTIVAR
jgi:hypothetical protein